MPARDIKFQAFEAFLCQVTGEYKCKVWLRNPKTDGYAVLTPNKKESMTLELDLQKTPALCKDLADVEIDDFYTDGGLTRLGPRYPGSSLDTKGNGNPVEAGIWLTGAKKTAADALLARLGASYPPVAGTASYQWESILHIDDPVNMTGIRRYLGYHAQRVASGATGMALRVWRAEADIKDPVQAQHVIVTPGDVNQHHEKLDFAADGDSGVVYLEWEFAKKRALISPKLPIGFGGAGGFPSYDRGDPDAWARFPENYAERFTKARTKATR